jgi:hypothetical protein
MQPAPNSCSTCTNLVDGRCHGMPPRPGNLAGHAVFPIIVRAETTVCRAWTDRPFGQPDSELPDPHERSVLPYVALSLMALAVLFALLLLAGNLA